MMRMAFWIPLLGTIFISACGPEHYTCTYEVREESTCSQTGNSVDDWEKSCKYVEDAEECEDRTTDDKFCDTFGYESCCIESSYRDVELEADGTCFWEND
jgi:hypothetical protein